VSCRKNGIGRGPKNPKGVGGALEDGGGKTGWSRAEIGLRGGRKDIYIKGLKDLH